MLKTDCIQYIVDNYRIRFKHLESEYIIVVFNTISVNFQLYHSKNMLHFNEIMMFVFL
jgi:hypothetical protein